MQSVGATRSTQTAMNRKPKRAIDRDPSRPSGGEQRRGAESERFIYGFSTPELRIFKSLPRSAVSPGQLTLRRTDFYTAFFVRARPAPGRTSGWTEPGQVGRDLVRALIVS